MGPCARSALRGNEWADFARVRENDVRAIAHHAGPDQRRGILFGAIAARIRF